MILGGYELATVKFPSTSLAGEGGAPIDFLVQITSSSYLPPPPPPELGIHIVLVDFPSNRQKVDENEKEGNSHNIVIPPLPPCHPHTSLPPTERLSHGPFAVRDWQSQCIITI